MNKRYGYGLTGSASYTWSHAIDEGQGGAGTPNIFASGGPQSYVPGDYRGEKGTSALDVRHRAGDQRHLVADDRPQRLASLQYLANGWGLSMLATLQSSPASTPVVSFRPLTSRPVTPRRRAAAR